MYAKVSSGGLRFFAHAPGAPHCVYALESVDHHLLKLELANATRVAGADAELEVRGPERAWRADVLATDVSGRVRVALEAQLAPITVEEISERTETMAADGVRCCWFSDRAYPIWLGDVPSARLARSDDGELCVVDGLATFDGQAWANLPATPLTTFLRLVFADEVVAHGARAPFKAYERRLSVVWTDAASIRSEKQWLAEDRARRRENNRIAARARRERNAAQTAELLDAAAAEREARGSSGQQPPGDFNARPGVARAVSMLAHQRQITATVGWTSSDRRYAGGTLLVDVDGTPVAIIDPMPGQVWPRTHVLLSAVVLLFSTATRERLFTKVTQAITKKTPELTFATAVVDSACACPTPELTIQLGSATYQVQPSERPDPAARLARACCAACGGRYDQPWSRVTSR